MNWGTKIVIAYICFGIIIFSMVWISMKQDISLVAKDYYKQEIAYQDQIDRMDNFSSLEEGPTVDYYKSTKLLKLNFPEALTSKISSGTILLFRPSKSGLDKNMPLNLNASGNQEVDTSTLAQGLWKVKLNWNMSGKEYYFEKIVVI